MKKIIPYWKRFWHCTWYTFIIPFTQKYGINHTGITREREGNVTEINCACGKTFYKELSEKEFQELMEKVFGDMKKETDKKP